MAKKNNSNRLAYEDYKQMEQLNMSKKDGALEKLGKYAPKFVVDEEELLDVSEFAYEKGEPVIQVNSISNYFQDELNKEGVVKHKTIFWLSKIAKYYGLQLWAHYKAQQALEKSEEDE